MARPCSACVHPDRRTIDNDRSPSRHMATRYGLSEAAVRRHRAHLATSSAPAPSPQAPDPAVELRHTQELLAEVRRHRDDLVARLEAGDTAQAELRRLVAQAAGKPLALEVTGRTVDHPLEDGADRLRRGWLPWRRSSTVEAR